MNEKMGVSIFELINEGFGKRSVVNFLQHQHVWSFFLNFFNDSIDPPPPMDDAAMVIMEASRNSTHIPGHQFELVADPLFGGAAPNMRKAIFLQSKADGSTQPTPAS